MKTLIAVTTLAVTLSCADPAQAAEYKCRGNNVTKSGGTYFKIHHTSYGFYVSRSGSTRGEARVGSNKTSVTVSGSTIARFDNRKIYKSGGTWTSIREAQLLFDCSGPVAATLWVLRQIGEI